MKVFHTIKTCKFLGIWGLGLALGVTAPLAQAGPNDYVHTPLVTQGERELSFRWGAQKFGGTTSTAASSVGFGYGINSWWFSELYVNYERAPGNDYAFEGWAFENIFQLTERDKHPIELGFLVEVEHPQEGKQYLLAFGPLLQKNWGPLQANINLLFEKQLQTDLPSHWGVGYQTQLKYAISEHFAWGMQAFGAFEQTDSTPTQHKIGPAIFGEFALAPKQSLEWNTALLLGLNNTTEDKTLRVQLEYVF